MPTTHTRGRQRRRPPLVGLGVVAFGLLALSGASSSSARMGPPLVASGLAIGQFESLRDWRDFADLVVRATVESERAAPEGVEGKEEYHAPRRVALRIDSVLFSRVGEDVPAVELVNDGYMFYADGPTRPVVLEDGVHLEVGHEYIVALALSNARTWGFLTPDSVFPVEAGKVSRPDDTAIARAQDLTYLEPYLGTSVHDIDRQLDSMPPDPHVERYAAYGGYARLQLVVAAEADDRNLPAELDAEPVLEDLVPPGLSQRAVPGVPRPRLIPGG